MTITPEEARRLVAKFKERGLIIAPVEQPTIEPKRRVFNRLSTIECDQCHQPFEQTSPTQKRCKGQCSVKARSARRKQWLTEMRDALDPDHWMNGGECDHPHPDALAMDALDTENKQLRAEVERNEIAQELNRLLAENTKLTEQRNRCIAIAKRLMVFGIEGSKAVSALMDLEKEVAE